MKRAIASTRVPVLLSLLLLSACSSDNHSVLVTLEAAQREVVSLRAQLEALNVRLESIGNKTFASPGHVSKQRSYPGVDVDAELLPGEILSTGQWNREIARSFLVL